MARIVLAVVILQGVLHKRPASVAVCMLTSLASNRSCGMKKLAPRTPLVKSRRRLSFQDDSNSAK